MQLNEDEGRGMLIPSQGADVGGGGNDEGGFVATAAVTADATMFECLDHAETVTAGARTSSGAIHSVWKR